MLRLNLFGTFSLESEQAIAVSSKKAQALLALLALTPGQFYSRERLAALLRPVNPEEAARQSLRQCISVLRRNVPGLPLVADHDRLAFVAEAVARGVPEFENLCADRSAKALKLATELYRGDLLECFDARSDLFEAWLIGERIRLRAMAISALRALLDHLRKRNPRDEAYGIAHRLLAIDPLQEDVHRTLMRMHFEDGQTARALRPVK